MIKPLNMKFESSLSLNITEYICIKEYEVYMDTKTPDQLLNTDRILVTC